MINFRQLQGVRAPGATGQPNFGRTPEGIAIGGIPGWRVLLDPSFVVNGDARNRVRRYGRANRVSSGDLVIGQFPGTFQPAFRAEDTVSTIVLQSQDALPQNEFTIFSVAHFEARSTAGASTQQIAVSAPAGGASERSLRFSINNTGSRLALYANGANSATSDRLVTYDTTEGALFGSTHLFAATFSPARGYRLFLDGEQVAHEADAVPIESQFLQANAWEWFRLSRGYFGMSGVLATDISRIEAGDSLFWLKTFLGAKYSAIP